MLHHVADLDNKFWMSKKMNVIWGLEIGMLRISADKRSYIEDVIMYSINFVHNKRYVFGNYG
jgi:hypothetical protein